MADEETPKEEMSEDAQAAAMLAESGGEMSEDEQAAAMMAESGEEAPQAEASGGAAPSGIKGNLEIYGDIMVEVSAVLGNITMPIEQFLKLGRGAILELNRGKDEDIDLKVNGHLVAKAEITVVDEKVGISVTKLLDRKAV